MRDVALAFLLVAAAGPALAAEGLPRAGSLSKMVLALGETSYLTQEVVGQTGAILQSARGEFDLDEYSLLVLSNVPLEAIPGDVRDGIVGFLGKGGSLLVTGGAGGFGSGGYGAIAPVLPFGLRAGADWRANPFKPVLLIQPGHPIFADVAFPTIGSFNDMNPRPGAIELAQYHGGGLAPSGGGGGGGARFASPLVAELGVGAGLVLGIAFDLGEEVRGGWGGGPQFVRNLVRYLVDRSPLTPRPRQKS